MREREGEGEGRGEYLFWIENGVLSRNKTQAPVVNDSERARGRGRPSQAIEFCAGFRLNWKWAETRWKWVPFSFIKLELDSSNRLWAWLGKCHCVSAYWNWVHGSEPTGFYLWPDYLSEPKPSSNLDSDVNQNQIRFWFQLFLGPNSLRIK